jgi:hypothetical protein
MIMMSKWFKQLHPIHKIFLGAGLTAALIFGYNYLLAARGDCGVVRFYEYTFGFFGIGVWGGGNLAALLLLLKPKQANAAYKTGTIFLVVINSLMIFITSSLIYSFMDSHFVFTSNETLIRRVEKENDRLAVLELGKRNEKDTIPLLCKITLAPDKDINLRLNSSYALRKIASGLPRDDEYYEEILSCLFKTLADQQQHLRSSAAKTLGIIKEPRSVMPLLQALEKEDDEFVKGDIVQALGLLADKKAHQTLSVLLADKSNSYSFNYTIKKALEKIEATETVDKGD